MDLILDLDLNLNFGYFRPTLETSGLLCKSFGDVGTCLATKVLFWHHFELAPVSKTNQKLTQVTNGPHFLIGKVLNKGQLRNVLNHDNLIITQNIKNKQNNLFFN